MSYQHASTTSSTSSSSGATTGADLSTGAENSVAQEALPTTYTVQPGDTLSAIARALHGDPASYTELFDANTDQLANPNVIRVGQVLRLPESWLPEPAVEEPAPAPEVVSPAVEQPEVPAVEPLPAEIPAGEQQEMFDALVDLGEVAWQEIEEAVETVADNVVDLWEDVGETVSGWWHTLFGPEVEAPAEVPDEVVEESETEPVVTPAGANLSAHPGISAVLTAYGADAAALSEALAAKDQAAVDAVIAAATGTAPDSTTSGDLPEADLAEHRGNRARPLDYDATNYTGITSEAPEEGVGTTLDATFDRHFNDLFAEEFGEDRTLEEVTDALHLAEELGLDEVHGAIDAALFRVRQYAAVETLNVEDSDRYAPTSTATYCNIYAYDLVSALGGYIPRTWWYDNTIQQIEAGTLTPVTVEEWDRRVAAGEPTTGLVRPVYGETVREMNANSLNDWFDDYGADFGWTEAADMGAAQDAANSGQIVVITAANANSSRSGHISVILAETDENTAARNDDGSVEAPLQSQAGSSNFKYDDNESSSGTQWWENANHTNGAAWIFSGSPRSTLAAPEQLGL